MSVLSNHFSLGLGTSRFPVSGPDDTKGIEKSVNIVLQALNAGINYIDTGHNYSAGMAPRILKEAFQQTDRPFAVTAKVQYGEDLTADDARRRVELHLKAMGLEKAKYFVSWSIWNWRDFEHIMEKGGIYEGALKLQQEGIIEHICCSLHAPPEDMIRIIQSGAFEGITISYSLLNAMAMGPVLAAARKQKIGVAVMNPLGGGLIAQNRSYFSFACGKKDHGNTVHAALRFVKAHPAVDIVLGGVSSKEELADSLALFAVADPEMPEDRRKRVIANVSDLKGFCTGCKYCTGCSKGIPTYSLMQARNALLFAPTASYNRQEPEELLYNLQIFRKLYYDEDWLPDSSENPCVQCGKCEKACTQNLSIIQGVADIYHRAELTGYTKAAHKERLRELLWGKGYHRVGLYPSGNFFRKIIRAYEEFFGKPDFEWLLFNSNKKTWNSKEGEFIIHAPTDIPQLHPDIIIISTYRFDEEILESLRPYEKMGILVKKLHQEQEVPWIF